MFNLAWTEILLIIIVAVVVIGPTQLPGAIRGMADGIKKAKRQLAAFQQQADELVREAKLEGVRDQIADVKGAINEIRSFDLKGHIQKAVDEDGTLTRTFNEDPLSGSTTTASTPAWTPPPTARDTPDAPAMIPPQTMAPYKPPPEPPKPEVPAFLPPSTPAPLNMAPPPPPPAPVVATPPAHVVATEPAPVVAPVAEAPAEIPPAEAPRIENAATEAPAPAPVPAKTA
ncbi:twin-arginine translocase TatA/TatE family subunit [Roseococcus microcysteis]|uniref:twin-arginine translocase TatA/TatE family subunit n=1 Tax=Roseococcus microcysteis TaxID=2771361 RepID=UPI00168AEA3E|nr:twin-arginine translocase TatA/TatE family subunit [Roseococcus microcysteis]